MSERIPFDRDAVIKEETAISRMHQIWGAVIAAVFVAVWLVTDVRAFAWVAVGSLAMLLVDEAILHALTAMTDEQLELFHRLSHPFRRRNRP